MDYQSLVLHMVTNHSFYTASDSTAADDAIDAIDAVELIKPFSSIMRT